MTVSTGTFTFLFTDIEGSTRLWERDPEAMSLALARHDHLLRTAIETHNGQVFKTIGDAFCAVFMNASEAIAAALTAQLVLLQEPSEAKGQDKAGTAPPGPTPILMRVRMALHTGIAEARDGDYFGQTLNRTARLLAIAHGGQVLLSQQAEALSRGLLPTQASLIDLAFHRLKDLQHPEHVWQLCHPTLLADFPPLNSLDYVPHNLPHQMTSFIGREREIEAIKRRLAETRLVTLTGPGGSGKTRLALQVAAEMVDRDSDGVWLVELAALTDPALVPQQLASVLNVREGPGRALSELLIDYLARKNMLLVLDNCEHLIDACAKLCARILAACPQVRILATSQQLLGISGEQLWQVSALTLPTLRTATHNREEVSALLQYEAIHLFADRAAALAPNFAVTNTNVSALVQVCRRLDGIPLAIELAAARVRVMPVEQIAERLNDRFRLLTGGSRTALPRHQTLRALIDWSYDLLSEPERNLLRRLTVFQGGFQLEAVEAVCATSALGGQEIESWEVVDLIGQLAGKSLVIAEVTNGEMRYRLLETVRQYAADRLRESGELSALRERHQAYYTGLALRYDAGLAGSDQFVWMERLDAEHDNMRAALDVSSEISPDVSPVGSRQLELRLAGALWRYWFYRSHLREGRERLARVLAHETPPENARDRVRALAGATILAFFQGAVEQSAAYGTECLTLAYQIGDSWNICLLLNLLGVLTFYSGDGERASAMFEEGMNLSRSTGNLWTLSISLSHVGLVALYAGDPARAQALCEEALAASRSQGERWCIGNSLYYLGTVVHARGDYARARRLLAEGLVVSRELGQAAVLAWSLEGLASAWGLEGDAERATQLLGAAEALREVLGAATAPAMRASYDRTLATVRAALGEAEFARLWQAGREMSREQAVSYALMDEGFDGR
jgi:predicted ATPase/class 3 adenylate cyclase